MVSQLHNNIKESLANVLSSDRAHHAYILDTSADILPVLEELLAFNDFPSTGNSDYFFQHYDIFGVEDARILKEHAVGKPLTGDKRVFVLDVVGFTRESQNALLKLFEEPASGVYFFVRTDAGMLLPTLLSRVIVVDSGVGGKAESLKEAKIFLNLTYKERLDYVARLAAKHDKDENSQGLKLSARTLVYAVTALLHENAEFKKNTKEYLAYMHELEKTNTYLSAQGAMVKMLLENMSLALPVL